MGEMALTHRQSGRPDNQDFLHADFDAFLAKVMEDFHIPGASIAVVHKDRIESKGYGVAYENGPSVTPDTLFNAASMSKSFTAGAVGLLVDDKENFPNVKWDTPISTLMREEFVLSDAYATANATALDVLSHRTGLMGHDSASSGVKAKMPDTPESITRKLRHFRLNKPFRTTFQYNNDMFIAASYLVEKLTNTPFYSFLKTKFWDPLSMSRTFGGVADLPDGQVPEDQLSWSTKENIALPHLYIEDSYKRLPFFNEPEGQGAGNIISTAHDFAKWIQSMMLHTNAISPDTICEIEKPRILSGDNESQTGDKAEPFHSPQFYCTGWDSEYYRGHKVLEHSGGIPGFTSLMRYLPEHKFGVVMFGNSGGMADASEVIGWKLVDDFLQIPENERMDWTKRVNAENDDDDDDKEPFPNRADLSLPLPLPLHTLSGNFAHPGFGEYTFKLHEDGKQLVANALDRTFGFWIRLEHVSGLYFIAHFEDGDGDEDGDWKCEAEFRVGADGVVRELGMDMENEEGSEMYWFRRVED